ncbi:hypothetical protein HQ346_01340 [Rhodococcus sp. BP-252]|uniref:Uncharacterized protein n=1 Tax=Rhodococcoides kyotonense TaxID=398843 RepID=A0A177YG10_9NOCA|nr:MULTISPECIES: hypothetical protein [Rhodococcus]MBY6410020.1 hypothetical protein [Rhodococcus sp. BP-320]MBY6414989.1 hypothetical protein [Rhodococcus sp. BP-321]MBY6421308.1 hypothetical protein [Rhodococcus sp. BP-324]MBY6425703.1 hypothetical protein [Rhodococcus sp. BP-323]MBY6429885.1 hypothetical protein [Rhodococcus sp. BP-322]
MSSPSASLAVWASSWLAGIGAPDDVIDALTEWAPMHLLVAGDGPSADATGLSWPSPRADGVAGLLTVIRRHLPAERTEPGIELLLPGPGATTTHLPPGTPFARSAIGAEQAVVVGDPGARGLGIVPTVEGPDVLRWTVFVIDVPLHAGTDFTLGEAEYAMREAVRGAADALGTMQSLPTRSELGDPRARIAAELAELSRHRYPDETPERALRVLESADRVAAILSVARHSSPTEEPTAHSAAAREDLIRPLWNAVRSARLGAISASIASSVPRR